MYRIRSLQNENEVSVANCQLEVLLDCSQENILDDVARSQRKYQNR